MIDNSEIVSQARSGVDLHPGVCSQAWSINWWRSTSTGGVIRHVLIAGKDALTPRSRGSARCAARNETVNRYWEAA